MTPPGRFDPLIDRSIEFVMTHRARLFYGILALALLCSLGMATIRVENNFRAFVGNGNTALETNDWLSARQGEGLESVVLLYRPADQDAFSTLSLLQYVEIVSRAKTLPHATHVSSWLDLDKLVDVPDPHGGPSHRKAAPFLYGLDTLSPAGAATLRADALASPVVAGRYVGRDGRTAAVLVSVDLGQGAHRRRAAVDELAAAVAAIDARLKKVAPGDSLGMTGTTLFDHAAFLILKRDLHTLFPLAVAMVAAILLTMYRSVPFVGLFMLLTVLPVTMTAGIHALLDVQFTNLSIAGLLLVGTLSVADIMHLSNSYFLLLGEGVPKERALRQAFRHNLFAVTATTTTTVMGEATMFFTSPPPVQMMGIIVMVGSEIALVMALTMLPYALAVVDPPRSGTLHWLADGLARASAFCHRHGAPVLGAFTVLLVACGWALPNSRIDDSVQGWFGEHTAFHQDLELLKRQYLGSDTVVLALEVRPEDMASVRRYPEPSAPVALYDEIDRALREAAGPGEWFSLVSTARARRERLDGGAPTGLRVAADDPQAAALPPFTAQALTKAGLLTRLEPGRADYSLWYFHGPGDSSFALTAAADKLQGVLRAHAGGRDVRMGGVGVAIAQVSVTNLVQVLWGTLFVFGLIVVSMFVVFRSVWIGALSIVPNVAPIVFSFGLWAWCAGGLNMAAVTVLGVAFGIVVDDTIHLLTKYREFLALRGEGEAAFRDAVQECGTGVLATTLVLAGGFALLGTSNFELTAQRCQLSAITIGSAVLFDLLMLPALLSVTDRLWVRARPAPNVGEVAG